MITCRVDKTGEVFDTVTKLAKFLKCANSNINYAMSYCSDRKNHFRCKGYDITILQERRPDCHKTEQEKQRRRKYYQEHRDYLLNLSKEWRKNNPEKVKEYKERWRQEHKEWFNAYYREQRRKKKEAENA